MRLVTFLHGLCSQPVADTYLSQVISDSVPDNVVAASVAYQAQAAAVLPKVESVGLLDATEGLAVQHSALDKIKLLQSNRVYRRRFGMIDAARLYSAIVHHRSGSRATTSNVRCFAELYPTCVRLPPAIESIPPP